MTFVDKILLTVLTVLSLWNKHFISVESIYLKHLGLEVKMTSKKWTNEQSRKVRGELS